jgi:hypothetical protein
VGLDQAPIKTWLNCNNFLQLSYPNKRGGETDDCRLNPSESSYQQTYAPVSRYLDPEYAPNGQTLPFTRLGALLADCNLQLCWVCSFVPVGHG